MTSHPTLPDTPARAPRRTTRLTVGGVFGELLVTAGIVGLLFLGWQMWGQSWIIAQQQQSAASDLGQRLADRAPSQHGAAAIPVMGQPGRSADVGVLQIPRLGSGWKRTIREGIGDDVLNSYTAGIGHYPKSQLPGQVGNFAVAGHDTGWGNSLIDLSKMQVGDKIYVHTTDGWYTYGFRNFEYVQPDAYQVVSPVPRLPDATPVDRYMTITTCNPPFHAGERLIAYSTFESYSPTRPEAVTG
jgi:sortase A